MTINRLIFNTPIFDFRCASKHLAASLQTTADDSALYLSSRNRPQIISTAASVVKTLYLTSHYPSWRVMDMNEKLQCGIIRYFWSPPCYHNGYNISNVSWRKLDIVLGASKTNRLCPFFQRLHQSICDHMVQPHSALFIRPYGRGTVAAQGKGGNA